MSRLSASLPAVIGMMAFSRLRRSPRARPRWSRTWPSQAGIYEVNESFSAAPGDYDRDGDSDVFIGYHARGGKLWRNDGGVFTRVNPTA
jgi:hypothetical protein